MVIKSKNSVGIVKPKKITINEKFIFESKKSIPKIDIQYETYGKLNKTKTNAILIFHALSGDAHVAGKHKKNDKKSGWWDIYVGPNKTIDTKKFFVICSNVIGGCSGTTGPSSINPKTNKAYNLDFPIITIKDMVRVQKLLLNKLKIKTLHAVIGGSMGGMLTLQFLSLYPEMAKLAIPIATTLKQSPQAIAFHGVARRAIMTDPEWKKGNYTSQPANGLSVARMLSHITYVSEDSMWGKFGRKLQDKNKFDFNFNIEFEVESYLNYQGISFTKRFDANTYLYITRALDYFDLTNGNKYAIKAFSKTHSKCLVISLSSDWLYSPTQCLDIVDSFRHNDIDTSYVKITTNAGHDGFLIENKNLTKVIKNFLESK